MLAKLDLEVVVASFKNKDRSRFANLDSTD
jgi:hypothetical protein